MSKLSDEEKRIVEYARQIEALPELCTLVDYEPDIGRVSEYWKPTALSLALFKEGMKYVTQRQHTSSVISPPMS